MVILFVFLALTRLAAQPSPVALRPTLQKFAQFYPLQGSPAPAALTLDPKPLPVAGATVVASSQGVTWIGTSKGLIRTVKGTSEYFASRRYLPDDDVRNVAPVADGAWVRTRTGIAKIELRPMTLAQKAAYFEKRIVERHDRHGMVADSVLREPGNLASNETFSNDNDGLWTAMYAAAKCFEYAVTRSPAALARARRATEAVLFLEQVTGRPGFPARSYIKEGERQPNEGFWYPSADGKLRWKADTSSDEIVGHFLIFGIAHDLLPDTALRARIVATARRMMDHILENKLYLVDVTGKPTRWGKWSPEYFASPNGLPDSPLNAVELLSFLKTTFHLTRDARYQREYERIAGEMGYAEIAAKYLERLEILNYSDEELAMLSFYPLFVYEKDEKWLAYYRRAADQWWKNIQREQNPLWTYIYLLSKPRQLVDVAAATETLYRIPMDLVRWTIENSHRTDVEFAPGLDRFRKRQALTLLPADERPVMKWNGNPFVIDGGCGGCSEDDGAFFLLPYWMGRYHRFLSGE